MTTEPKSKILVTYASTHRQTEKIARRMAGEIESRGITAEVRNVAENPDPGDFDAVVAGASLHAGKHQAEMHNWIEEHRDALRAQPGAFFSVSLTAAEETPEEREPAVRIMEEFLADAGWESQLSATIAGGLLYREYDRFTRTLIKLMMSRRLALISVVGRRTGDVHTFPVGYGRNGDLVEIEVGWPERKLNGS